jgi:nucleoside-diphosphate-sugar epimerase
MSERTAVVTGASGRIGRTLCKALGARHYSVCALAHRTSSEMIAIDLAKDGEAILGILERHSPQVVFHCAGVMSRTNPVAQFEANVMMTVRLTQALGRIAEPRPVLVNVSSAAEIGAPPSNAPPLPEDFPCAPYHSYGASKLCQTEIALASGREHGYRVVCARIFNLLRVPDAPELPVESWVAQIHAIRGSGGQIRVGNIDVVRDFIDLEDATRILIDLAEAPEANGIVNVASGVGTRLSDILVLLRELSGVQFEVVRDPARTRIRDIPAVVASVDKLTRLVGRPPFDLRASLAKMLAAEAAAHV